VFNVHWTMGNTYDPQNMIVNYSKSFFGREGAQPLENCKQMQLMKIKQSK